MKFISSLNRIDFQQETSLRVSWAFIENLRDNETLTGANKQLDGAYF